MPVTSGIPQWLIPGPLLFNIFINNLEGGTAYTYRNFAEDTKLGGLVDTPDICVANKNIMMFNNESCQVLHLGSNNPFH